MFNMEMGKKKKKTTNNFYIAIKMLTPLPQPACALPKSSPSQIYRNFHWQKILPSNRSLLLSMPIAVTPININWWLWRSHVCHCFPEWQKEGREAENKGKHPVAFENQGTALLNKSLPGSWGWSQKNIFETKRKNRWRSKKKAMQGENYHGEVNPRGVQ